MLTKSNLDVCIPLARALSHLVELDLVFVVGGQRHTESCLDMDLTGLPLGLTDDHAAIADLLGPELAGGFSHSARFRLFRFASWSLRSPGNLRQAFALAGRLRRGGYDLIHFNGVIGLHHGIYYLAVPSVPKVQTIHDTTSHSGEEMLRKRLNRWLQTRLADRLILHSEFCREDLIGKTGLPANIMGVVPFGPVSMGEGSGIAEDPMRILFFGRMARYKGLDCLMRAFSLLRQECPEARLTVAGSGPLPFDARLYADDDGVRILNRYIPNAELAELIQEAAVVVMPYLDATQSGVAMTAFAYGKPVVASRVGGLPEVVRHGETGLLVPPADAEALSQALRGILCNQDMRRSMAQNVRRVCATEFSWDVSARRTLSEYGKILA